MFQIAYNINTHTHTYIYIYIHITQHISQSFAKKPSEISQGPLRHLPEASQRPLWPPLAEDSGGSPRATSRAESWCATYLWTPLKALPLDLTAEQSQWEHRSHNATMDPIHVTLMWFQITISYSPFSWFVYVFFENPNGIDMCREIHRECGEIGISRSDPLQESSTDDLQNVQSSFS